MKACDDCSWLIEQTARTMRVVKEPTCLAFWPAAIPEDILDGTMRHTTVHPSQHNELVFRPLSHFKNVPG